jgi:hypothetical protein
MRKVSGIAALVLGLVLIAASGVVRFSLADKLAVMPGDLETQRIYTGTAAVLVNPSSLTGVTIGPGILRNVPITVRHYTEAIDTKGNAALVHDERIVSAGSWIAADLNYRFGIDRKTFSHAGGFPDLAKSNGLTINWPIGTNKHDYIGWIIDAQRAAPVSFLGTAKRGGIETYVFRAVIPTMRIRDPELLKILPPEMSKKQLLQLTPSLELPLKKLKHMDKVLSRLPDPVPLAYTYSNVSTFWVAPATGVVVDHVQHEIRSVGFLKGNKFIPSNALMDMTYRFTPATVKAAAQDAKDGAAQLKLIRSTAPLVALVAGVVLTLLGLVLLVWRRRRPITPAGPPPIETIPAKPREPAGVG